MSSNPWRRLSSWGRPLVAHPAPRRPWWRRRAERRRRARWASSSCWRPAPGWPLASGPSCCGRPPGPGLGPAGRSPPQLPARSPAAETVEAKAAGGRKKKKKQLNSSNYAGPPPKVSEQRGRFFLFLLETGGGGGGGGLTSKDDFQVFFLMDLISLFVYGQPRFQASKSIGPDRIHGIKQNQSIHLHAINTLGILQTFVFFSKLAKQPPSAVACRAGVVPPPLPLVSSFAGEIYFRQSLSPETDMAILKPTTFCSWRTLQNENGLVWHENTFGGERERAKSQAVVEIQKVADYVRQRKTITGPIFHLTVMVTLLDSGLRSSTSGGLKRQNGFQQQTQHITL